MRVKTSGHGPTGITLTAVHAKREEGRSADGACCNVQLLRINSIKKSIDVKGCIDTFH